MQPQERKLEEKQEVTNDVIRGTVYQTVTTLHKNVDTGEWFPVAKMTAPTQKTVEEFKTAMLEMKAKTEEAHAEEIQKFDAAIAELDSAIEAEIAVDKQTEE